MAPPSKTPPPPGAFFPKPREAEEQERRLRAFARGVWLLFAILLGRFWFLQIAQGDYYLELSERNRTVDIELPAPRGIIRDRHGVILATTRPAFSVSIMPAEVVDLKALLARLSQVLSRPVAELGQEYHRNRIGRFKPVPIARDVPISVITTLEEERSYLPGVLVASDPVRVYPRGAFASHVLGYVREISREELAHLRGQGYRPRDIVGKTGVEKAADRYLRGRVGRQRVWRDAQGNLLAILGSEDPVPGDTVTTTLDVRVQRAAENGVYGKTGAAVALDPRTGDILALASSPTFDPAWFTRRMGPAEYQQRIGSRNHPMLNRATGSAYPPGSTFKIVSAVALLQEGVISERSAAYCAGAMRIGNMAKRCWSRHGSVNTYSAIARSCDVFFYHYGSILCPRSPDRLARWAERFGLGHRAGLPFAPDARGNVPHLPRSRRWYPGDTANMVIGQGAVLATPFQIAQMTAALANGGKLFRPRVIRRVVGPDGRTVLAVPPQTRRPPGPPTIRPDVLRIVRLGVRQVVTSGTGRGVNLREVAVAGKTGSAEHRRGRKAHAWFTCYAPFEAPTIAIAVLVEEGGHGSSAAAPIARRMLEAYFELTKEQPEQPVGPAD